MYLPSSLSFSLFFLLVRLCFVITLIKGRSLKALNVFVIVTVIVFVFVLVAVFLLVRSCFLIALITCLKGQKYQRSLFEGVL